MKATSIIVIIGAVLSLQASTLFANNGIAPISRTGETSASWCVSVAPSTPSEATFEEMMESTALNLGPVTPAEADFASEESQTVNVNTLIPVTPTAADFSDGI
jgi:hypothetical protein